VLDGAIHLHKPSTPSIVKFHDPSPHSAEHIAIMLTTSVITIALSTIGFAQAAVPAGYNKVYLQTMVDTKFVVQAKATTTGSTVVV
jgi:hypothetical protein